MAITPEQIKDIKSSSRALLDIIGLFLFFNVFRAIDIFWLKLDETFGDIIISKSINFVFIIFFLVLMNKRLPEMGLKKEHFWFNLFLGVGFVLLSILPMRVIYSIFAGNLAVWDLSEVVLSFVYFTLMTNLVNVMMEEGLFRGIYLPMSLNVTKTHVWKAIVIQAFFFGIWHWIWPIKELIAANMTTGEAVLFAIIYFIMSFGIAIPWGYYYYKTGSIMASISGHLIWNTVLGLIPLPQENLIAFLLAFICAIGIAVGTIPLFDKFVPPKYIDELEPW